MQYTRMYQPWYKDKHLSKLTLAKMGYLRKATGEATEGIRKELLFYSRWAIRGNKLWEFSLQGDCLLLINKNH